jgi:hypothetical protein
MKKISIYDILKNPPKELVDVVNNFKELECTPENKQRFRAAMYYHDIDLKL